MQIAQIAPLWERVPPPAYGGTELIVSLLSDELVRRGHEVTLFATGDSVTLARLDAIAPKSLRIQGISQADARIYEAMHLSNVYSKASHFDVIHSHVDFLAFPYANLVKTPTVHTTHGIFPPTVEPVYSQHRHQNFVSISNSQRHPSLGLNYVDTVYNGIDLNRHPFSAKPENPPYLAFLGRMSPEKGPHLAIEIAKRTGWSLKMAGKIDPVDVDFFHTKIEPKIDGSQIQFLGEASHPVKTELIRTAVATLFPITWKEPFGLVTVESMACGTPVIAMALGAAPEVVVSGQTGFLCNSVDECVDAVAKVYDIDRLTCRQRVEQCFSIDRMVDGYEAVYRRLASDRMDRHVPSAAIAA
jgi:glycosyltransferase involved in cell wall biosynthesis